jgi:polysaccharide export outer membrane protein
MNFKWCITFMFIFLVQYISAQSAESQTYFRPLEKRIIFEYLNKKYATSLDMYYQQRSIISTIAPQVLEDTLDVLSYVVGPGDVFEIYILGGLELRNMVCVNPEGRMVIPSVGEVIVSGMSIKDVKKKIINEIRKIYTSVNISMNILELRKFRIYLTGSVEVPGTYFVQAPDRVSEVLEIANGFDYWADKNNIEIRHKDGSIDKIDLDKFYLNGDKSQNPCLRAGDIIHVPDIDIDNAYLVLNNSNIVPYIPDEGLYDFLLRVDAIGSRSDLSNIKVIRNGNEIKLDLLVNNLETMKFPLQKYDQIIVPDIVDKVYIRGQVMMPGEYPFYANNTAKDYIGRAGVPETASSDKSIIIIRYKDGKVLRGSNHLIEIGDTIIVPRRFKEDLKEYISIIVPIASIALSTYTILILKR